ncbi:unnamed protein product [Nezara viridula]|uniref:Uncharacterized protein n=1 Tax=Nezara viridula TaxID=85310 RepID=A0A9P0HCQ1_NEZVI|nr:unnamed protein product [Nezara viridula]
MFEERHNLRNAGRSSIIFPKAEQQFYSCLRFMNIEGAAERMDTDDKETIMLVNTQGAQHTNGLTRKRGRPEYVSKKIQVESAL